MRMQHTLTVSINHFTASDIQRMSAATAAFTQSVYIVPWATVSFLVEVIWATVKLPDNFHLYCNSSNGDCLCTKHYDGYFLSHKVFYYFRYYKIDR